MTIQTTKTIPMNVDARHVLSFTPAAIRQLAIAALITNLEVYCDMIGEEAERDGKSPSATDIKNSLVNFRESTVTLAEDFLHSLQISVLQELNSINFDIYVRRMDFDRENKLSDVTLELDVKP